MRRSLQKVPIKGLQGIFSLGGLLNLALIKATSDLHLIICSGGHLYLGRRGSILFLQVLSDDSGFLESFNEMGIPRFPMTI
jgi:hypothetical protein